MVTPGRRPAPREAGDALARELCAVAVAAARKAGEELLARCGRPPIGLRAKSGPADFVTASDRAAEASIAAVLAHRRPEDGLLGEEGTCDRLGATGLRWVVDPLDGTANYVYGIPFWCVSIACEDTDGTVAGVVFDPVRDELFSAARGQPAQCNGAVIERRAGRALREAAVGGMVACATDAQAKRHGKLDRRLYRRVGQRRSLGAAALELAWTAAGRLDVCYQEQRLHPWDVDAGLLLCRQAGLRVHRLPPLKAGLAPRLLAAPPALSGQLLEAIGPPVKQRRRAAGRERPHAEHAAETPAR